jgi:hypothetical protein
LIRPIVSRRGRQRVVSLLSVLLQRRRRAWIRGGGVRTVRAPLRSGAYSRLNVLDTAHVLDANGGTNRRRSLADLLNCSHWKRAARIPIQLGLLPLKWHRSRRRSGACHHWPAKYGGGRTRSSGSLFCTRAEDAGPLRRNLRSGGESRISELGTRYGTRTFRNTMAVGKPVLRNRRNGVLHVSVRVIYVVNCRVVRVNVVVVIVVDGGVVDYRVGSINPTEVAGTNSVRGDIRLSRSQWEPAHSRRIPE